MSTSYRPLASLDQQVEERLNEPDSEIKVRRHPGVFNRGIVQLPDQLKEAVDNIITDKSVASLYNHAKELNYHLIYKKPPVSAEDLNSLKKTCREEVEKDFPIPIGLFTFSFTHLVW